MAIYSLKFGGTSMGSAQSMTECADIVACALKEKRDVVVTVSAVSKVTRALIALTELARSRKPGLAKKAIKDIEEKHLLILIDLLGGDEKQIQKVWNKEFAPTFEKLYTIIYGSCLVGDLTDQSYARICSTGEKLSSRLFSIALEKTGVKALPVYAERIVHTNADYLEAEVNERKTRTACRRVLLPLIKDKTVPVVTGFIGVSPSGELTLLGRGASDYTAVILGEALDCKAVEIWTDVNGIMSADPRMVNDAVSMDQVNVDIASEMTMGGTKVVHAKSVASAVQAKMPVYIFNTFDRSFKGTKIVSEETPSVIGFASDADQLLLHFKSPGMKGQIGFLEKITSTFEEHKVSVDLCATSEITVTMSIHKKDLSDALVKDLSSFAELRVVENVTKISIVGYNIVKDLAMMDNVFSTCHTVGVNFHTISIGASYRNVTLVVDSKQADELIINLHKNLFPKQLKKAA